MGALSKSLRPTRQHVGRAIQPVVNRFRIAQSQRALCAVAKGHGNPRVLHSALGKAHRCCHQHTDLPAPLMHGNLNAIREVRVARRENTIEA